MFATITSTGWLASLASAAGGTRAINRPIQFDYSVMAITSPDGRKALLRFRGWLNVGLKRSKTTATLEGQAERHAADLTR